jgi:hypothetical protein
VTAAITYPAAIKFYLTDAEQRHLVLQTAARLHLTVRHQPHTVAFDVIVRSMDEALALGLACKRNPRELGEP